MVKDTSGNPVAGLEVSLYSTTSAAPLQTDVTAPDGSYAIDRSADYYRLGVHDPTGAHLDYWYDGATELANAAVIPLDGGSTFTVDPTVVTPATAGTISGTANGSGPLAGITVDLFHATSTRVIGTKTTDGTGTYSFNNLLPGDYKVHFSDPTTTYGGQFASGKLSFAGADTFTVGAGDTVTAKASLELSGSISGTVSTGGTGNVVVVLYAQGESNAVVTAVEADASGLYLLDGLNPGTYYLAAGDLNNRFRPSMFFTPGVFDFATAYPFVVGVDENLTGIDMNLSGLDCDPAVFYPGVEMPGADLSDKLLMGCDLYQANFSGALFHRSNLAGAQLDFANLTGADFTDANLKGADLQIADVPLANFTNADLTDAHFAEMNGLAEAIFIGTNLTNVRLFDGAYLVDKEFIGTNLTNAMIRRADLSGANFTGAKLVGTDISEDIFAGTNFTNADLTGANIDGADFTGAIWNNTTCVDGSNSDTNGGTCFPARPTITKLDPSSGLPEGGYSILIHGYGFTGATAVTFGSTPAMSFSVDSDTVINAKVPAGTGIVNVRVTRAGGVNPDTERDDFHYVGPPAITKLAPSSGLPAGGYSITIEGTGFTGATAVYFGSTEALSFGVDSDTSINVKVPAGTGVVDVTVTTPSGTNANTELDDFYYV